MLAIVVSKAEDKAQLRLLCAQLRDMVDSAATSVRGPRGRGLIFTSQLVMRLPRLTEVDIWGCREIADLTPLMRYFAYPHLQLHRRQQPGAAGRVHATVHPSLQRHLHQQSGRIGHVHLSAHPRLLQHRRQQPGTVDHVHIVTQTFLLPFLRHQPGTCDHVHIVTQTFLLGHHYQRPGSAGEVHRLEGASLRSIAAKKF